MLCNTDEDVDKEAAYVDVAIADRMAGVIIAVASTTRSSLDPLVDAGIPVVAVDRRPQNAAIDSVLVDNRLGARLATEHLLDGGATPPPASRDRHAQQRGDPPGGLPGRRRAWATVWTGRWCAEPTSARRWPPGRAGLLDGPRPTPSSSPTT